MRIFGRQSIKLPHYLKHLKHHWFELKIISLHFGSNYSRVYGLRSQHCIISTSSVFIINHMNNVFIPWLPINNLLILTFLTSLCILTFNYLIITYTPLNYHCIPLNSLIITCMPLNYHMYHMKRPYYPFDVIIFK